MIKKCFARGNNLKLLLLMNLSKLVKELNTNNRLMIHLRTKISCHSIISQIKRSNLREIYSQVEVNNNSNNNKTLLNNQTKDLVITRSL